MISPAHSAILTTHSYEDEEKRTNTVLIITVKVPAAIKPRIETNFGTEFDNHKLFVYTN